MGIKCQICGYERQPDDANSSPVYECPKCHSIYAIYAKIEAKLGREAAVAAIKFFDNTSQDKKENIFFLKLPNYKQIIKNISTIIVEKTEVFIDKIKVFIIDKTEIFIDKTKDVIDWIILKINLLNDRITTKLPKLWLWPAISITALLMIGITLQIVLPIINNASFAQAIRDGNSDQVKALLKLDINPNDTISDGITYLDYVTKVGNVQLAEILLDHGAKIPKPPPGSPSLLHRAAEHDYVDMVQLLLNRGMDIESPFPNGTRLIRYAVDTNKIDLLRLLLKRGANYSDLIHQALTGEDTSVLVKLFNAGLSLDIKKDDQHLIEWAIRNNRTKLVTTLINHGANLNVKVREKQSLLALAVALDLPEIVGILVDHGANINEEVASPVSNTFLELFKTKYARFFLTKDSGLTPIMLAILRGRQDTVRTLLTRKARLDTPTKKTRTWPLAFAANTKNVQMMQLLLGRDPDKEKRQRHIVVSLPNQTATFYVEGKVALKTRVSTGRKGYATPPGEYVITNKHRQWTSTIYGASMPYFLRLNGSAIGLHQGIVPNRPASHGCIRVPSGNAARLFAIAEVGDLVTIESSASKDKKVYSGDNKVVKNEKVR